MKRNGRGVNEIFVGKELVTPDCKRSMQLIQVCGMWRCCREVKKLPRYRVYREIKS